MVAAKDLDDQGFLFACIHDARERGVETLGGCIWTIHDRDYGTVPLKVVAAKARALIRRGFLTGCVCGCRGDFLVTAKGWELLGVPAPAEEFVAERARLLGVSAVRPEAGYARLTDAKT